MVLFGSRLGVHYFITSLTYDRLMLLLALLWGFLVCMSSFSSSLSASNTNATFEETQHALEFLRRVHTEWTSKPEPSTLRGQKHLYPPAIFLTLEAYSGTEIQKQVLHSYQVLLQSHYEAPQKQREQVKSFLQESLVHVDSFLEASGAHLLVGFHVHILPSHHFRWNFHLPSSFFLLPSSSSSSFFLLPSSSSSSSFFFFLLLLLLLLHRDAITSTHGHHEE